MSQKFCHNCGKQAQTGWKACPFCETSFASLSEVPKPQKIQTNKAENNYKQPTVVLVGRNEDGEDDDSYLDHQEHYKPKIEALAVEIEKPRMVNKESFQQIATNPFSSVSNEPRPTPPLVSPEEAIRQFQQEAGNAPRPQS